MPKTAFQWCLCLTLAGAIPVAAQMGPQPGSTPWPNDRGGGGLPLPIPGHGKKNKTDDSAAQLQTFTGVLRQIGVKSLDIELEDGRVLSFSRVATTKFYKDDKEANAAAFATGNKVSVEAREDDQGYYTAVNVHLEKAATAAQPENAPKDSSGTEAQPPATTMAPKPVQRDSDDPGPPVLARGKPRRTTSQDDDEAQEPAETAQVRTPNSGVAVAPNPAPAVVAKSKVVADSDSGDPLIDKAREATASFAQHLPNYICKEYMARYASRSTPANWSPLDVVSADIVYLDGREDYRHLAIDNRPVNKKMEEMGGAWSTGELGSMLLALFSPATDAEFHLTRNSRVAGMPAKVYSFTVPRQRSNWDLRAGSQSLVSAYKGAVWIDPGPATL